MPDVPAEFTQKLNAILTATLDYYEDTLADNVFRSNVTLAKLREKGNITEQNGGTRIIQPLMYGRNPTIQSYSGYDKFKVEQSDGISGAVYNWRQIGGSIIISRLEERVNSGEQALFNLLEKKVKQAEMTLQEKVNNQLINSFDEGNAGKDLTPLFKIVDPEPTTGVVGSIDAANHEWWRNRVETSDADSVTDLKQELRTLYNVCSRGGLNSRPDLTLTDQITYEQYEDSLDEKQRYVDTDIADLGFENLKLKGGVIAWEEVMPDVENLNEFDLEDEFDKDSNPETGTALMLNTEHIELVVDKETRFKTTEFKEAHDQDASIAKLLFMGNMTCNNRAKQGVLKNINRDLSTS